MYGSTAPQGTRIKLGVRYAVAQALAYRSSAADDAALAAIAAVADGVFGKTALLMEAPLRAVGRYGQTARHDDGMASPAASRSRV